MKMSDVFEIPVTNKRIDTVRNPPVPLMDACAHAVNCHDDLVEALEAILWMAEQWFEHGGDETTLADDYRADLEKANSALAKSRGEG